MFESGALASDAKYLTFASYIGFSASESQDFWKKLWRDRPRLCHSFRDFYRGLRVILGLDSDCELHIDNMNPVELVKGGA